MGLFNLVPDWRKKILDDPLDARMTETLNLGLSTARDRVHVRTGFLKSTIGGGYNKSTKTIQVWADAKYSWVEEFRQPGDHHYLLPAMQAMAGFWGGRFNLEAHFPNAAPKGKATSIESLRSREESAKRSQLGLLARRKAKIITRRWHRRMEELESFDPTTPIL